MNKDNQSALGVYSVIADKGGRDRWVNIGSAVPHTDGKGFDVMLRALPLDARLVLREPVEEEPHENESASLARQVEAFERAAIMQCLLETGGNIGASLERLKIPRRTLNEKMARLGIDRRSLTIQSIADGPKDLRQDRQARRIGREDAKTEP
jgi:Bacterial regulatory protein, Fis family